MDADATMERSASGSVFNLYQEGLKSDQVLQLCFMRRRAPRQLQLERTRIEDEFVLPRPELKIASLLPPTDFTLDELLGSASLPSKASNSAIATSPTEIASGEVRESARRYFLQPQQAAVEVVRRWAALEENDWIQIHRSLQRPKKLQTQDTAAAQVPDIVDVCWMLEQCPSDAFASFVWDHLLISLLQQCVTSDTSAHERLFTLLVNNRAFASLSPKDFRAKVRARNLRQVDDAFGAESELILVALYRKQRDAARTKTQSETGFPDHQSL